MSQVLIFEEKELAEAAEAAWEGLREIQVPTNLGVITKVVGEPAALDVLDSLPTEGPDWVEFHKEFIDKFIELYKN